MGTRKHAVSETYYFFTKQFIFAIDKTSITLHKYVATCFDKLRGHPQGTRAHKH